MSRLAKALELYRRMHARPGLKYQTRQVYVSKLRTISRILIGHGT